MIAVAIAAAPGPGISFILDRISTPPGTGKGWLGIVRDTPGLDSNACADKSASLAARGLTSADMIAVAIAFYSETVRSVCTRPRPISWTLGVREQSGS
jgi:hypothetical protein